MSEGETVDQADIKKGMSQYRIMKAARYLCSTDSSPRLITLSSSEIYNDLKDLDPVPKASPVHKAWCSNLNLRSRLMYWRTAGYQGSF